MSTPRRENFVITDDAHVEVLDPTEEVEGVQPIHDALSDDVRLETSEILIPTKLPFKILLAIILQMGVVLVGGTSFYLNVNNTMAEQSLKLERIEKSIMTKEDAENKIKLELQALEHKLLLAKIEEMKDIKK